MEKIIAFAKLPLSINRLTAWEEVKSLVNKWNAHFNTAHYSGEWTVIALRSPGGYSTAIIPEVRGEESFDNTALMEHCQTIKKLVASFECLVMSVRLMNLKRGAIIKQHRDTGLSFEMGEARLHFPLLTNDQVEFYVEENRVIMQEGECWYINANFPHRVANLGQTDRVHLVVDCKVNDWCRKVFTTSEITYAGLPGKTDDIKMIIRELRGQNTETANNIADQLEIELKMAHG